MTPEQLRELADALDRAEATYGQPFRDGFLRATAYLREQADAMESLAVAWTPVCAPLQYETRCADGTRFLNVVQMPEHATHWRTAQPCPQSVPADVVEALRALADAARGAIFAGRQIEHYTHPSIQPLSLGASRMYELARIEEAKLNRALDNARAALAAADQEGKG